MKHGHAQMIARQDVIKSNMRCIETTAVFLDAHIPVVIKSNMRCIETYTTTLELAFKNDKE